MRCCPGTLKRIPHSQRACQVLGWQPNLVTAGRVFLFIQFQTVVLLKGGVEDFSVTPPTCFFNQGNRPWAESGGLVPGR